LAADIAAGCPDALTIIGRIEAQHKSRERGRALKAFMAAIGAEKSKGGRPRKDGRPSGSPTVSETQAAKEMGVHVDTMRDHLQAAEDYEALSDSPHLSGAQGPLSSTPALSTLPPMAKPSRRARALLRAADRFHDLFPARLAVARREAGWTQEELAYEAGVSMRSVTRYEAGDAEPPTTVTLRLAAALDCELLRLVGP
jgi:DNA-binding XRE family transcriptional regulator